MTSSFKTENHIARAQEKLHKQKMDSKFLRDSDSRRRMNVDTYNEKNPCDYRLSIRAIDFRTIPIYHSYLRR